MQRMLLLKKKKYAALIVDPVKGTEKKEMKVYCRAGYGRCPLITPQVPPDTVERRRWLCRS